MSAIARRFLTVLEPLVSSIYFAPEATQEYQQIGLDPVSGYFVSRSAALGRVSPDAVAALFYSFNPVLLRGVTWGVADPQDVLDARSRAVRRAFARLLDDADIDEGRLVEAGELLREAAAGCRPEGRALFAAHAALQWPEDPRSVVWHGANLLREYRGDGHIAVLLSHGMRAVDAVAIHAAIRPQGRDFLLNSRMWGEDAYAQARARLATRGFLDQAGEVTDGGRKFREMIEVETDRLASAPFEALGVSLSERLLGILEPLAAHVLKLGGISDATVATGVGPTS
ncbi:MAG: hypothetical protein WDA27_13565 [Actinomycetota bacterium]